MRPLAEGLFTDGDPPRLIGGRHIHTGRVVFPRPSGADQALYEEMVLAPAGVLWSWTVQRFRPKSPPYAGPELFQDFALGYVALPGQTIVIARLAGIPFPSLRVGLDMAMSLVPFATDADGTTVLTYAFGPVA